MREWKPSSWQSMPAKQLPVYPDEEKLAAKLEEPFEEIHDQLVEGRAELQQRFMEEVRNTVPDRELAAATGIKAIGIFAPMRPIHPGRWKPIGKKADYVVLDKKCNDCKHGGLCNCILSITPNQVFQKLIS